MAAVCCLNPCGKLIGVRLLSPYLLLRPSHCSFLCHLRRQRSFSASCASAASPTPTPTPTVKAKQAKKNTEKQKVIVISGPTGTGKSRLAFELAKRLKGEIVSADSVQVYQGLDVGSAKPPISDREEVPHHLIDVLHPSEEYSVGQFFEDAREATKTILNRGRIPIIIGGTGLYLRWFIYGKPDVPKASLESASAADAELANLEGIGDWSTAVELVVKAGDSKAQYLPANDWYRLRRSLEIIKETGSPPSAFPVPYEFFREQLVSSGAEYSHGLNSSATEHKEVTLKDLDYEFICFFLASQRLDLYRSIDARCEEMMSGNGGILYEANWLLDLGLLPNMNSATRAIGYRQAMDYLLKCQHQGGASSSQDFFAFLSDFQKASRNFAKRQMTWFRNELIYQWLDASRPTDEVVSFIHDAYHAQGGTMAVPARLQMEKYISGRKVTSELKAYQTTNRRFIRDADCRAVLEWIRTTLPASDHCDFIKTNNYIKL